MVVVGGSLVMLAGMPAIAIDEAPLAEPATATPQGMATPTPYRAPLRKHVERVKPRAETREAFLIEPDPLAPVTRTLTWLSELLRSPTTKQPLDLLPELVFVGQHASRVADGVQGLVSVRYEVEAGSVLWDDEHAGFGSVRANFRGVQDIGEPAGTDLSANLGAQNVNAVWVPYRVALRNWWWWLSSPDRHWRADVGKIDPTNYFDLNAIANVEETQFLSGGLVNNPAIPFPDDGIGLHLRWHEEPYAVRAAVLDANATPTTIGFESLAQGRLLGLGEFTMRPEFELGGRYHAGNYRFIAWGTNNKDATGVGGAVSFDQSIPPGIVPFFRFGYAEQSAVNPRTLPFHWFVSGGVGTRPPQRDDDLIAIGASLGESVVDVPGRQGTIEIFWRVQVTESVQVSPDLQLAWQPATGGGPVVLPALRVRWSYGGAPKSIVTVQ